MPEKQNVEWKAKWKDEYLEWVCGGANAQGGKSILAVMTMVNMVGINNARRLLEDIPNKV